MAVFFTLVPPQLSFPLASAQQEVVHPEQPSRAEDRKNEQSEWPLSIREGRYTFDTRGALSTNLELGKFSCPIESPFIQAAVSNFIIRGVNPEEELEWKYGGVSEKVHELITNETEAGRDLFYLQFETNLERIATLLQDYTYSCVETLAVMTDRGLRPLISVTEVVCDGNQKIIFDVFDRERNKFGTFDYRTWKVIYPSGGEMLNVGEEVMQDLHDALTFRIAMSEARITPNQKSVSLGWIKDGDIKEVVLKIQRDGSDSCASIDFSCYSGVAQPVTLTAHLVRDTNSGTYNYPLSQPLDIISDIGKGTLRLRD